MTFQADTADLAPPVRSWLRLVTADATCRPLVCFPRVAELSDMIVFARPAQPVPPVSSKLVLQPLGVQVLAFVAKPEQLPEPYFA